MNFYIKIVDGKPHNHPIAEENLLEAYQIAEVTSGFLEEHSLVPFERPKLSPSEVFLSEDGYTLGEDNVARSVYSVRELSQSERIDEWVRGPRNFMLARSDWTQVADVPLSAEKKEEWAVYRQALRDMTITYANIESPSEIVPPTEPS